MTAIFVDSTMLLLLISLHIEVILGIPVDKQFPVLKEPSSFFAGSKREYTNPEICSKSGGWQLLSVVPGTGWDNLVNEERGPMVVTDNYSKCRLSGDGQFLIPDEMTVEPLKSSELDLTAEVLESLNSYRSLTATSVNSAVDVGFSYYHINGDFSFEKELLRELSETTKGLIVRSQLRHKRYTVRLMPDPTLHPILRKRLLDIAAYLRRGNVSRSTIEQFGRGEDTSAVLLQSSSKAENLLAFEEGIRAFYDADLIVRDYGTHTITSVDAGGVLVKTDTLNENTSKISKSERDKLAASATATFANILSVKAGGAFVANKTVADEYSRRVTNSRIVSHGGPIFRAYNMELAEWEGGLDNNLVAIDRSGIPIYELITARALPELEEQLVLRLAETIKSAVQRYYSANSIIGCTDPTSVFYDHEANIASSECGETDGNYNEPTKLPLGGLFQKCYGPSELCESLELPNPATGYYSCPHGYMSVRLVASQVRTCYNKCHRSIWGAPSECHQECAVTQSFWCSLDPSLLEAQDLIEDTGFIFTGLYTDKEPNFITQRFTCPAYSWPLSVGRKIRICLSVDKELAGKYGIPFGGFYSCKFGNPLVSVLDGNGTSLQRRNAFRKLLAQPNSHLSDKNISFLNEVDSSWPKRCPKGYTTHLAAIEETCQINFCIPANTMKKSGRRHLKRPPFVDPPAFYEGSVPSGTVGNIEEGSVEKRQNELIKTTLGCIIAVLCVAFLALAATMIVRERKFRRLPLD